MISIHKNHSIAYKWRGERTQWLFTKTMGLPKYTHAVRIVLLWEPWNGKEPVKMLITNQTYWDVTRVVRGYGQRWIGTETLHRDGKQHLGLEECRLCSGEGADAPPLSCAVGAQSVVAQLRQGRVCAGAHEPLTTSGEACRAIMRETLSKTITWAIERATLDGWQPQRITAHLQLI